MHRVRLPLILLVPLSALALALGPASARPATTGIALTGTTGPGFTISLKDANGTLVSNLAAGDYTITMTTETVPPGYITYGEIAKTLVAKADDPMRIAFDVRAIRSISGRTNRGVTEVRLEPLGRVAKTDADGNFVFRSLPAGTFTLVAKDSKATVTLPATPLTLTNVTLE